MEILMILKHQERIGHKILVKMQNRKHVCRVKELITCNRDKEAFDLVMKSAQVSQLIRPGVKLAKKPEAVLIGDMM